MRISESFVSVDFIESKDYGSAGITSDAVNMSKLSSLAVLVTFGAITGNSTLLIFASAARDLTTTAIAFSYRLGAAVFKAALADQLSDAVAVAATGLVLVAATFKNRQLLIEIDSDTMPEGKPWLTFTLDATATVLNVGAIGLASPRLAGHVPSTIL